MFALPKNPVSGDFAQTCVLALAEAENHRREDEGEKRHAAKDRAGRDQGADMQGEPIEHRRTLAEKRHPVLPVSHADHRKVRIFQAFLAEIRRFFPGLLDLQAIPI